MRIYTKQELRQILTADSANYQSQQGTRKWLYNISAKPSADQRSIWLYIKTLRKCEYYRTRMEEKRPLAPLCYLFYLRRLRRLSYKTGFQLPLFVCGEGLTIWHWGSIIVNEKVRIGRNCTLYPGVLIGHKTVGGGCPQIGDNVFIGSGAKIIGDITIGNNVTIAANSIVTHDIPNNAVVVNTNQIMKYNHPLS